MADRAVCLLPGGLHARGPLASSPSLPVEDRRCLSRAPTHSLPLLFPPFSCSLSQPALAVAMAAELHSMAAPFPCPSPPPSSSCSARRCWPQQDRSQPPRPRLVEPRRPLHRAGRPQLGVAEPASRGLTTASSGQLPACLVDRSTSTLACSSPPDSPATSPATSPAIAVIFFVPASSVSEEEEEGVNRK